MEYAHKITKENLTEELIKANEYAKRNDSDDWIIFAAEKLPIEIHDDYFMAEDLSERGYVFFTASDFISEHLIFMIKQNPALVSQELVLKVIETFIDGLSKD